MLPDDVFRAYFDRTSAALMAWRGHVADVATCRVTAENRTLRLELKPNIERGCPVELVIYPRQCFDIAIGAEVYEDLPTAAVDDFVPLLAAVVDGRVLTRIEESATTGRVRAIETVVRIADGRTWRQSRRIANDLGEPIVRAHHWLPYRRD
jgi:hypothetical protein